MITRFYVMTKGDPQVGIQAVDTCMDLEFDIEDFGREELRDELTDFFTKIYGEKVGIEFEDERQAWMEVKLTWMDIPSRKSRRKKRK